ncbi:YbjN domain-containing protein [Isoptericola jiangsuensis]|uniref:YbjN domain-containing protein n=1 Tax=Isoptericola jiangsuensis TaxID=548579 RepID=UPI003AAFA084
MSGPLRRAAAAVRQAARRRAEGPAHQASLPSALTAQRVADDLARRGYRFRTDDDGDITGTWDGNRFWFLLLGEDAEILQVRGRWSGAVPEQARTAVLQACNDWNRERLWPKVYTRVEDGAMALYGEVSVDLEHGVTDDQIAETLSCGLVTTSQFFASLASLGDTSPS